MNQNPTIGIIGGKGRMGRHFANFFKERGVKVLISDTNTSTKNTDLASKCEIIIVSVPIDKTEEVIGKIIKHIPKTSALMDFTSIKQVPVKAMLKGKCEVLGMHPMFGESNPIPSQKVILCPTNKSGKWSNWMMEFLKQNGVEVLVMTPEIHDKTMSTAQGLIHFAEITFADSIRRAGIPIKELLNFTSLASELKTMLAGRIIHQSSNLYGNIQIHNPNTLKSIKNYRKSVNELYKIIKKKDLKAFEKYFNKDKSFFGKYTRESHKESTYLIDKLLEQRRIIKPQIVKPKKGDIAVLGPKNTFTDIGADEYMQNSQRRRKFYVRSIDEIVELVEKGKVACGIIPIENKIHGTVRETLDSLFERKVKIIQELSIPIHHCLIALSHAGAKDIKKILSHSQALNQCKKFLANKYPKAEQEAFASTAAGIEKLLATRDKSIAVIASKYAKESNELTILNENIEDQPDNKTTFVIVEKGEFKPIKKPVQKSCTKTSVAFFFKTDSPGTLFTVFEEFAKAKINLTKVESRPTKAKFGEYIFYIDFDGCTLDAKVAKVLKSIEKKVAKLKILGSY